MSIGRFCALHAELYFYTKCETEVEGFLGVVMNETTWCADIECDVRFLSSNVNMFIYYWVSLSLMLRAIA